MNESGCWDNSFIRVLSPMMLPPVIGLLGSTASTATRWPSPIKNSPNASMKVLFPTPGTPVIPIRKALPVCGKSESSSSCPCSKDSGFVLSSRVMALAIALRF